MLTNQINPKVSNEMERNDILARFQPDILLFWATKQNTDGISIMKNITPTTLHP